MFVKEAGRGPLAASFDSVPAEMMINIFSYLSAGDLARAMQVCRNWHRLAHDDMLWRPICLVGLEEVGCSWYERAKWQAAFVLTFFQGEALCREPLAVSAGLKASSTFSPLPFVFEGSKMAGQWESHHGDITIWDLETGKKQKVASREADTFTLKNGAVILSFRDRIERHHLEGAVEIYQKPNGATYDAYLHERWYIVASYQVNDPAIYVIDAEVWRKNSSLAGVDIEKTTPGVLFTLSHKQYVNMEHVAFFNHHLVSVDSERTLRIWDLDTGNNLASYNLGAPTRSKVLTECKNDVLVSANYFNYLHQTTVAVKYLDDCEEDYQFIVAGELISLAKQGNVLAMIVEGENDGIELQIVDIKDKLVSIYPINSFVELNSKRALWHTTVFNLSWNRFKLLMTATDELGNTIFETWDFSKEQSLKKAEKPTSLCLSK